MKNFWGPGVPTLLFSACLRKTVTDALRARGVFSGILILAASMVFFAVSASAQDTFGTAETLTGSFGGVCGSVTNDNTGVIAEAGDPTIAGFTPNAPLWYVWTAPQSGEVEMDTLGSSDEFGFPLDTLLGVYTGNTLASLSQVAANDDLYPVPQNNESYPEVRYDINPTNDAPVPLPGNFTGGDYAITQLEIGPSGLRFNAVEGQTYYIAVDSKASQFSYFGAQPVGIVAGLNSGPIVLTWAYKSSGMFRIATEDYDDTGNLASTNGFFTPFIPTSENESDELFTDPGHGFTVNDTENKSSHQSYYYYDVAGVPVTFTRVAGSSGRVVLTYSTEDGNPNLIVNGDQPAVAGVDYTAETNQTLIFDDGEMSKTIYVPILYSGIHPNRDFTINITSAQLDPNEDGAGDSGDFLAVSPPRVDSNFGQVEVRILDDDIDPIGPANTFLVTSNLVGTNLVFFTNELWNIQSTNAIFNFSKVNYRFPRDISNSFTTVTVFVERWGTNTQSVGNLNFIVDSGYLTDLNPGGPDITFPLEPASDYGIPFNGGNPTDVGSDYTVTGPDEADFSFGPALANYQGAVPTGSGNSAYNPMPISFTVLNNGDTTLDKDFIIDLYQVDSQGNLYPPGMVAQCKVTILGNRTPVTGQTLADNRIPAGSVDENYNIDIGAGMAPGVNTTIQNDQTPGTDQGVSGLLVLTNNETLAVGSFHTYDGILMNPQSGLGGICLIQANGDLDTSFNSQGGANVYANGDSTGYSINCVAMNTNNQQFVIGGSFTSYSGQPAGGVARVNMNGQLDSSFNASVSGNSATVYSIAVQPNGQVLIGGDFLTVDGYPCPYVARLNPDGTLDQSFNTGPLLNGPVFALAPQQTANIVTNVISTTGLQVPNQATINVNTNDVGTVNVSYIFPTLNDMQVYYGGNLIYDTGPVTTGAATPAQFSVPYGPGNTPIVLLVNPGGALPTGTNYSYGAVITAAANNPEIMVGGDFSVTNENFANIALIQTNGNIDTSFNPPGGADHPVRALDWQPDGKILVGGEFQNFNGIPINRLARVNADGSLDTTNFYVGLGADDVVDAVKYINPYSFITHTNSAGGTNAAASISRAIYIGGQFNSYNGTHRLGFARLYTDGTVDTTFMDTTYNQFAGLAKIYANDLNFVDTIGVQGDGNVMIGGSFDEVGGGEADKDTRQAAEVQYSTEEGIPVVPSFTNKWLWLSEGGTNVEPNARDGVRTRDNIARLIGGATPGPGNLLLVPTGPSGYSFNRDGQTHQITLIRTNGFLGPELANFSVVNGTAQNGPDLTFQSAEPQYWLAWNYTSKLTRMHTDGLAGYSGFLQDSYNQFFDGGLIGISEVNVQILKDVNLAGNLSATFQLANPANADQLYLGGEDIPLGTALGFSSSSVALADTSSQGGTFGFASPTFIATNATPTITVIRTNGAEGNVTLFCSTNSPNGGTAVPNSDYTAFANNTELPFNANQLSKTVPLTVKSSGLIDTNFTEKTVNLVLGRLSFQEGDSGGYGITNATVRLINPNFPGYLTLSAASYTGFEAPPFGEISFTVNRVAGNANSLTVQYGTTDGSAVNGQDYLGATNILSWDSGDVSPRTITLTLLNSGVVGLNKQFYVSLSNPTLVPSPDPGLFFPGTPGSITTATMNISDNNSYGSVQFSATNYPVNEEGGYATITVTRTGGVAGPAYVNFATADGSALASNNNYVPTNNTLTFAPNQLSASFNVGILNNGLSTTNLSFYVNLSNPVNLTLGAGTSSQVTILNDQYYNEPPGSTNGTFGTSIYGDVFGLAYQSNNLILAAGDFSQVNTATESNIVRLAADGSVDPSFSGIVNGPVQTVANQTDNRILIGGQFSYVGSSRENYIARLMPDGTADSSFDVGAGADAPVFALAETFINGVREIYAGGAFANINSVGSAGLARLNNDGTVDKSFDVGLGVDGTVEAIAVYPTNSIYAGDLLIGGSFVHYNGTVVNGITRLNADGSIDYTFNPGAAATNGAVNCITLQPDGGILLGGSFAGFNGWPATNIVRLNDDGIIDTNFVANIGSGADSVVQQIVLQPDNRILVVGQFTEFDGLVRNGVTRLLSTGAADPTINFGQGANGAVEAALVDPNVGLITLGGAFTVFNNVTRQHIVQLYGLSETGSGAFEFASPAYSVPANGRDAAIDIIRVGGTSGPNQDGTGTIFVNFSTVNNGTAVPGVDYSPMSTNVAFPAGAVVETVFVPIMSDFAATNNLTLGLSLTNATPPAIVTNQPTAMLTILNVNNAISFTSYYTNIYETVPGGLANIAVVRQGSTNAACSVDFFTTTNGFTAIPGVDFYPTNATLTFNPGVAVQTAQVLIISNSTPQKTLGLILSNAVDTVLLSPTNETVTILNNSGSPGQICFTATNYTVNESAGTITVNLIRTNGYNGQISYGYVALPGTAQPNINYKTNETTSGVATFDGNISFPITIPILENNAPEGPVTFSLVLTNTTTTTASIIAPTNATVTIMDDINAGVAFVNPTNYVEETNGQVSILVQRVGNTNAYASVSYAMTNGTAIAGINYVPNSGPVTFAPGETEAGITVTLMNQEDVTNLTFGISLLPTNSLELLSPSNALVVEEPAAAGISFTTPTNSVYKNSIAVTIPVICLDPSNEPPILNSNSVPLTVGFATTNGTGQAGIDYIATNGILTFTNGIVTNYITVPIINYSQITGLKTFGVNLYNPNPVPPGKLATPTNEVITIIDSNSGLEFSSANYSIDSGGNATITVFRVDNTNTLATVNYQATSPTSGSAATEGTDFNPTNGTLTFNPGQTSNSFNVAVFGSSAPEPDKTILLLLSDPTPTNALLTYPSAATLTIINQNGSFIVPAGVSPYNGSPAGGILQSNQSATLDFGFRDGGGLNALDVTATMLSSANIRNPSPVLTSDYGALTVNGHSVAEPYTFTPVGTNGQTISANFKLSVTSATNTILETNTFALTIGTWTTKWYNTNAIVLAGATNNNSVMMASPYPSIITVTNVGGVLVGATVTITNFSDSSPPADEVLLVAPNLSDTLLMSGIGSSQQKAVSVTLTFSNSANPVPYSAYPAPAVTLTNGVYSPTQNGETPFP